MGQISAYRVLDNAQGDVKRAFGFVRAAGITCDYSLFLSFLNKFHEGNAASDIFIILHTLGGKKPVKGARPEVTASRTLSLSKHRINSP